MKKILKKFGLIAFAIALMASTTPNLALALGTNGSFEDATVSGDFATRNAGDMNITGWTVGMNGVDQINTYWIAQDLAQSLDMNALDAGSISQTIPTTIGNTYNVSFYMSGNPDGGDSLRVLRVSATGANNQDFNYDIISKGTTKSDMKWEKNTYSFQATSASTTITFASQVAGAFGPALDNVVIEEVAPVIPATTVVISGNTSAGENLPGWMFNRDISTSTPFEFNTGAQSIGTGSLYVKPIGVNASDKFVGENFINSPITNIKSISYDFKIGPAGVNTQEEQFYMNVYANFGVSDDLKFYDCRYNVVPTVGSTGSFTTVTFDPTLAYPVTTRGGASASPFTCPSIPADMDTLSAGSNIRVFALNVGDTSTSDIGLDGYLDKVVVAKTSEITTYDFEPSTPVPTSSTVHIFKFIDGVQATTESANGVSFPMFTSTYNAPFTLGPNGWTNGDIAYEASTSPMTIGSSYSANENLDTSLVGSSCDGMHGYALIGYGVGDTMQSAVSATPTLVTPSFTNLQGDKYIIVRNQKCAEVSTLKVHILKYLDGIMATTGSANGYQFPMTATWQTANLNGGASASGNYVLGNNHGGTVDQYAADTAVMNAPASYTTSEITTGDSLVVSSAQACVPGKYLLKGYKTSSVSFADAATQTLTAIAPVFAGLTSDRYVLVLNEKCPTLGTISGMKYNDLNRNGKKDANEPGLAGWVIKLKNGNTVITDTTDANGNYSFENLAAGTYKVRETHKAGWKRMSKNPKPIVIVDGSTVTNVDFGNAKKHKEEREDNDRDDDRDDQSGSYHAHHGKSNYGKEQDKKEHEGKNKDDDKKWNGRNN